MSDRDIPSVPVTTLAGLTSLSDLLSELPISDSLPFQSNLHKSLLFHPRVAEEANNLLSSRDENLARELINAIEQTNSSLIELKPEYSRAEETSKINAPELLQAVQAFKPNVFNSFNQKYVNPNASQYHAQPQQNYSLHESYNQLNYSTTNYPVQTNQFQQSQNSLNHQQTSHSYTLQQQSNVSHQLYQQLQQNPQQLITNQDPAQIQQQQFQQHVTNQFIDNASQNLNATTSFQQQQQLLMASTSGSHIQQQQNLFNNQQGQVLNNTDLNYSQNVIGYYGLNIQQNQPTQTQQATQQTLVAAAVSSNANYNCATIDPSQLQNTVITSAQQKFEQTQYINNIQQQPQQPTQKINHLVNQQLSSSSSSSDLIVGPSTSNYSSSSAATTGQHNQQVQQQLLAAQTQSPKPQYQQPNIQQQPSTPSVNNMHLRNHVNKQELTQPQQPLPQQKVAPRNNEYLEQQQQQRPSPAQGSIAPEANHINPTSNKDVNSTAGNKNSNSFSINNLTAQQTQPTTSNSVKMDASSSSAVAGTTVPLLTTFDLPAAGVLDNIQNLNLKKIVINVAKIKVTEEEQKKMLEIKQDSIKPEANCSDMFSLMKEDERRTPMKRKMPLNDSDLATFNKPKLRRVERKIAPVTPKLSTEELMKTNTYIRFNNFIDKIFEQLDDTEGPLSMDDNDEAMECISTHLLNNVSAEAAKLKARSAIDAIPEDKLTLLISYAMRSVHSAKNMSAGPDLPEEVAAEDNLEKILNAIEASLIICNIYTSKDTKFLQEDNVDTIIKFVQFQLRETIFPSYDPVYTIETKKKVDAKKKKAHSYQQKGVSQLYTKIVELSKLFVRMFNKFHFVDTIIIHASALGVEPFFVDNIETLQFVCLDLVTSIFQNEKYKHHRHNILNDILSSVDRLPHSKKNLRPYKLTNNGGNIQMMTALVLQLIQCAVILPDELCDDDKANHRKKQNSSETKSITEKDLFIFDKYDTATGIGGNFLQIFLNKCKSRSSETDFRPLFENFIHDLLTVVNKPEWPAAELLLSLLGTLLVKVMADKSTDQSIRVVSLEYLGIVAARLRKDAIESRCKVRTMDELIKCIKVEQEKEGDEDEDNSLFELDPEEERVEFLQRILLDYLTLNSQEENPVWNHARHFYMTQWYRDIMHRKKKIAEGEKGIASRKKVNKKRKKYKSESENSDSDSDVEEVKEVDQELNREIFRILEDRKKYLLSKITPFKRCSLNSKNVIDLKTYLDYDNANLIAQYLASKRSFSQSYDIYLHKIILVVREPVVAIRTRAMKCLGNIVEVDQSVLSRKDMRMGVQQKLLDAAISVREAAVDLVGKYILSDVELVDQYYDMIAPRILDTGVSVRKRVIKILRDICQEFPAHPKIPDICIKMLRRVNDEEAIQKLVMDVFMTMWFTPCPEHDKAAIKRKVEQIIDVELSSQEKGFNGLLKTVFEPKESKEDSKVKKEIPQSLIKSCKQIVSELVESIMILEKSNTTKLVGCIQALHSFAYIRPKLLVEHAITLEPYLNIKCDSSDRTKFISLLAEILEQVVPLMEHPGEIFLSELESHLIMKIVTSTQTIVSSCIACLGAVVNKITKNYKLVRDCFAKFYYRSLISSKEKLIKDPDIPPEQIYIPVFRRAIFSVGLFMRYFNFSQPDVYGKNSAGDRLPSSICHEVFETLFYFLHCNMMNIRREILQAIGYFCVTNDEYLTKFELKDFYNHLLSNLNGENQMKITVLKNIHIYLMEQEHRMTRNDEDWVEQSKNEDLKEMGDISSGMSSRVIQIYLKEILNCFLNHDPHVRSMAMRVVEIVLRQGLVHPVQIVPYLICLSTDPDTDASHTAAKHLQDIDKQYQGFVNMKAHQGIHLSYDLQKTIQRNGEVVRGYRKPKDKNEELPTALNGFLYSLLRNTKPTRRALITSITKQFDDQKTTLSFMLYLADNLAYFPYVVQDEPLYIIHQIDLVISVTGTNLLQNFRDGLKPKPGMENISKDQINPLEDEDDEEDKDALFERLPDDTSELQYCIKAAQGCMLLLILKQHLKEMYGINDGKISRYSPSESTKIYDKAMQRKSTSMFQPKATIALLSEPDKCGMELTEQEKRVLIDRYLDFKQLMIKLDPDEQDSDQDFKPNQSRIINNANNSNEAHSSSVTNDLNNSTNNYSHVQNSNQVNIVNVNLPVQQIVPVTNFEKAISVNTLNKTPKPSRPSKTPSKKPATNKKKKRRKLSSSEEDDYDDDDYDYE